MSAGWCSEGCLAYFRGIRPGLIEAATARAAWVRSLTYFRGIRPGLIEAFRGSGSLLGLLRYFRGIRPGLIEALAAVHLRQQGNRISGASAPASLKRRARTSTRLSQIVCISGASAPASLKRSLASLRPATSPGISGASAPASLKHGGQDRSGTRPLVFPGHPPRPH